MSRDRRRRLVIASLASSAPMGAEGYQEQVARRADAAVAQESEHWDVERMIARSTRSALPGNRRLPLSAVTRASAPSRRLIGRLLYGGADVVHRMNLELPPAPHGDVVTLHDVVAWKFRDETAPVAAATAELRRADAVICVSEFSANEAIDLLGLADPVIVPNGVDQRFFGAQPLDPPTRDRWGIPDQYVLHAGGATQRQNLPALAEAWPSVHRERPQLRLVLSGPPHPRRTELFSHLPGAHLAGRLPDTVMPGLVAGARAVVVPSLYEGFGLPALEAMAAGVPLVAADTSALTEVAAGAGILVAPTGRALADGLISALRGDGDIDALVAAGRLRARDYTWERSAAGHARVWRDVAGR